MCTNLNSFSLANYIYRIAGYLHGVQLSWMPSIYHELVIFTVVSRVNNMGCIVRDMTFLCKCLNNINYLIDKHLRVWMV